MRRALDLQERSFRLLQWIDQALRKGALSIDGVHEAVTWSEAAQAWIERHHAALPARCRPGLGDLADFSRLVATALESSFELEAKPGQRLFSPGAHCFCPFCSWLVAAPHLRPKKLTARDKRRASVLEVDVVGALALELGVSLEPGEAERIAGAKALREAVALVAWARILLKRLQGLSEGPATLALWRRFAWTEAGAPRKGFKLEAADVLAAEQSITDVLSGAASVEAPGSAASPGPRRPPRSHR